MKGGPFSVALFHVEESARAARAAHLRLARAALAGVYPALYVYWRPWHLAAFDEDDEERPDGWTLAWAERVPGHLTEDQLVQWFAARSARVPYLVDEHGKDRAL